MAGTLVRPGKVIRINAVHIFATDGKDPGDLTVADGTAKRQTRAMRGAWPISALCTWTVLALHGLRPGVELVPQSSSTGESAGERAARATGRKRVVCVVMASAERRKMILVVCSPHMEASVPFVHSSRHSPAVLQKANRVSVQPVPCAISRSENCANNLSVSGSAASLPFLVHLTSHVEIVIDCSNLRLNSFPQ
jgi:hypothetical protein